LQASRPIPMPSKLQGATRSSNQAARRRTPVNRCLQLRERGTSTWLQRETATGTLQSASGHPNANERARTPSQLLRSRLRLRYMSLQFSSYAHLPRLLLEFVDRLPKGICSAKAVRAKLQVFGGFTRWYSREEVLKATEWQISRPNCHGTAQVFDLAGGRSLGSIVFRANPFLNNSQYSLFVGFEVHRLLNVFACS
jgi:hypothetical protein